MIDEKKLIERFEHTPALSKIVHNLALIVEEQPKVGEWIPVSERLPNEEEFKKDEGRFMLDDGNRRYQGFLIFAMAVLNFWHIFLDYFLNLLKIRMLSHGSHFQNHIKRNNNEQKFSSVFK